MQKLFTATLFTSALGVIYCPENEFTPIGSPITRIPFEDGDSEECRDAIDELLYIWEKNYDDFNNALNNHCDWIDAIIYAKIRKGY